MFRRFLPLLLAAACTMPAENAPAPAREPFEITRSPQQAVDAYLRVSRRIEPVAERLCRQKNPARPPSYCDFQILVDSRTDQPPNAFQTIGKDGRPIIAFNIPMVATVRNDDEIAFILGHEAGHQIRSHLVETSANAGIGSILLGTITAMTGGAPADVAQAQKLGSVLGARAYSQDHELEADEAGTYVAAMAGYDPLIGARSFARFAANNSRFSTHPPSSQRLATVQRTMARINARIAAGQPVVLP